MQSHSSHTDPALVPARNWVKKSRYVLLELTVCAMRHCVNGRFFVRQPLEKLYPLAHPVSGDLADWLAGIDLRRDITKQPYLKLAQNGVGSDELTEFLDQLKLFTEESLKHGFNMPPPPVRDFLLSRFHYYLQEARTTVYGLEKAQPANPLANPASDVPTFSTRLSAKFFEG